MTHVRWEHTLAVPEAETRERAEVEQKIAAWWDAFRGKAAALSALFRREGKWDLPAWMGEHLQALDAELMWEYGPAVRTQGHRLVITSESRKDLRPLVRRILAAAPTIDGWEFYGHRLAESWEMARLTVEARCGHAPRLTGVEVARGEDNRVDLTFGGPTVSSADDQEALKEAFVLAETLLGEEALDCWIGAIELRPLPRRGLLGLIGRGSTAPALPPIDEMKGKVDRLIDGIRQGLRDRPYLAMSEGEEWTLLELEAAKADDYSDQADLVIAKTPHLPLWQATRTETFHDRRFSRFGETFCYVKLDFSQIPEADLVARKAEIEDALDDLLKPPGWGCQIGGGTGFRYGYIELALVDKASALPAIRSRLVACNVPQRSWILFHDCELRGEWIGIHDDSPAPP